MQDRYEALIYFMDRSFIYIQKELGQAFENKIELSKDSKRQTNHILKIR